MSGLRGCSTADRETSFASASGVVDSNATANIDLAARQYPRTPRIPNDGKENVSSRQEETHCRQLMLRIRGPATAETL
jgi:hypothetical protein